METGSHTDRAFRAQATAQQHGQVAGDGQADSSSPVPPGHRGIPQGERVEDGGEIPRGDADAGVADGEVQFDAIGELLADLNPDLDLAAVAWAYDGRCPTPEHRVAECEGSVRRGGDEVHVETLNNARGYLVAVDGKAGVTAPFRLRVDCGSLKEH